jgi:hypothetical protein
MFQKVLLDIGKFIERKLELLKEHNNKIII